jgi:uncharacterized protein YigE (DUF2233 family)
MSTEEANALTRHIHLANRPASGSPCALLLPALVLLAACLAGCRPPQAPPAAKPVVAPDPVQSAPTQPAIATTSFAHKSFTVCRVDLTRQSIELFWRDDKAMPFGGFEALDRWLRTRKRQLVFAMNAGMYRPDFSPVGLYVEHGKQLRPLNLSRGSGNFCLRPNGVFAITRSGARIVESTRYPAIRGTTVLATQSGPMLVIDGRLHPAFRSNSTSRLVRNGVGVVAPQQVVFAISEEPVSFYEFATFFRDGLHCRNALFLDGSVSGIYSPALHRNDALSPLGPILALTGPTR